MDTDFIKQLLEAGAHFGHSRSRWNPKMEKFIFGERSKIYIIDLEKTIECISKAKEFLRNIASKGEMILFVGTKKQAQDTIFECAQRSGMYYVKDRWLGGTLTNFKTIRKSIKRLKEIETMEQDGTFSAITKKERAILLKEKDKLKRNLQGIVEMKKMPGALFIIDAKKEDIAIKEARKLSIPVVAIIDTNSNPDIIDYPIPSNDDAMRAIKLITGLITDAIIEGREQYKQTIQIQEDTDAKDVVVDDTHQIIKETERLMESIKVKDIDEKEEKKPKLVAKKKTYKSGI